jgi:hypothetical protein
LELTLNNFLLFDCLGFALANLRTDHRHTHVNDNSNCIVAQCGPDDHPIYLPSTFFEVLPGQPFKKPLSRVLLADFITMSCCGPVANRDNITGPGFEPLGIGPAASNGPVSFTNGGLISYC